MREAEETLIIADDPAAPREVAALAAEHGWIVTTEATALGEGMRVRVGRKL